MEEMSLSELAKLVIASYRAKHPTGYQANSFHARHAIANCRIPLKPKDWCLPKYATDPVIRVNPLTVASAVDFLADTQAERKARLDAVMAGRPPQKYDAIDIIDVKNKARFTTVEKAWDACREAKFEIADLGVYFEAVRFYFALTPEFKQWLDRVHTVNLEQFHADRRAKEAATAS